MGIITVEGVCKIAFYYILVGMGGHRIVTLHWYSFSPVCGHWWIINLGAKTGEGSRRGGGRVVGSYYKVLCVFTLIHYSVVPQTGQK